VETQFRSSFVRDLDRLSEKSLKQRIKAVIAEVENAASLRDIANLKKLQGGQDYYRIRVGDYRIGLVCQQGKVTFVRCLHRRDIYRFLP